MNRILLALLLLFPAALSAQETICTPFDDNGDNVVGIGDLIGLLARFGDSDLDQDGIWDSEDECVGAYDTCWVCNGPGPQVLAIDTIIITYDSVYVETIDEWLTYELDVDTLLHLVCENPGCTDPVADNFGPYAEEGGLCTYGGPCLGPTFDGYTYEAVLIGGQCWFAENLRTTVYEDGTAIPEVTDPSSWTGLSTGARCTYGNGSTTLATYGRLYNWYAVDDARGLCPTDWHVPTDGEYTELTDYLGGISYAGAAMKSSPSDSPSWDGTNTSGFSGLLGGYRDSYGNFYGNGGYFWSASPNDAYAWFRGLFSGTSEVYRDSYYFNLGIGFSVRCVRD